MSVNKPLHRLAWRPCCRLATSGPRLDRSSGWRRRERSEPTSAASPETRVSDLGGGGVISFDVKLQTRVQLASVKQELHKAQGPEGSTGPQEVSLRSRNDPLAEAEGTESYMNSWQKSNPICMYLTFSTNSSKCSNVFSALSVQLHCLIENSLNLVSKWLQSRS